MKTRNLFLSLLLQLALAPALHADTGYLIDDGMADSQDVIARVVLSDDGTPTTLNETDQTTVTVASNDATAAGGKNCKTIKGIASIYGLNHGSGDGAHQPLAGGGRLNTAAYTAAMLTVPLHKTVEVTSNGRTIKVLVNDRGPYKAGRVIDLTPAAARGLGFSDSGAGLAHVQVKVCN